MITGASGGIGEALCRQFLQANYRVIATDRFLPINGTVNIAIDLEELVKDATYRTEKLQALRESCDGHLDALVNNAALQITVPFELLALEDFMSSQKINVAAPFLLAQAMLSELRAAHGSIINIASIHAQKTKPNFVAYATSKAALLGLTQAMAVELGASIRVNAISPAAIMTPMLQAGFEGNTDGFAALKTHHPAGRIGTTDEVARLALFLASDQALFINGANLCIDGAIGVRLHDPE
ncbi:SDR family NAD(P)-dependent oxidoreductase [Polaromonas sp.]|uniref:SDR family NAD(P)-dependent oxidoreductase n=1 Tax=Polaromonas sp. TaxID=1869339 RepID=UPI003BB71EE0